LYWCLLFRKAQMRIQVNRRHKSWIEPTTNKLAIMQYACSFSNAINFSEQPCKWKQNVNYYWLTNTTNSITIPFALLAKLNIIKVWKKNLFFYLCENVWSVRGISSEAQVRWLTCRFILTARWWNRKTIALAYGTKQ
jgi:hypothetical protein